MDHDEEKGQKYTPERRDSVVWRSCCFKCDRGAVRYSTKTCFSAVILIFALYEISTNEDPCNPLLNWLTGLVGMVAGSFIEQQAHININKN